MKIDQKKRDTLLIMLVELKLLSYLQFRYFENPKAVHKQTMFLLFYFCVDEHKNNFKLIIVII